MLQIMLLFKARAFLSAVCAVKVPELTQALPARDADGCCRITPYTDFEVPSNVAQQ